MDRFDDDDGHPFIDRGTDWLYRKVGKVTVPGIVERWWASDVALACRAEWMFRGDLWPAPIDPN